MEIRLKKGTGFETVDTGALTDVTVLMPDEMPSDPKEEEIVRAALAAPVGTDQLRNIVRAKETAVIVTSDITRPCPSARILPALIEELEAGGIAKKDITVLFGRGSHRPQTEEEMRHLVSDAVFESVTCTDSDFEDVVHVGTTSRGTPVDLDRRFAEADRKILVGNVEYHYFAGYSGGAKAIMPGMSVPGAIQNNHSYMLDEAACAGRLEGNPVRQDIEEAAAMAPADFILNVVLNADKKITGAWAGDMTLAHREACRYLDRYYRRAIPHRAEIVLVSQGGAPKDLNLYQTQKALDNAKYAVREGGTIILCGSCAEGFGNARFEEWMTGYDSAEAMAQDIRRHFILGAHKAAAIGAVSRKADIVLVSDMDPAVIGKTILRPCASMQEAFDEAVRRYGAEASVIVMPYGGSTLPYEETE